MSDETSRGGSSQNIPDLTGLSEDEKNQLMDVMKKAKEFEEKEELGLMQQPLSGLLCKYTNVVKGWQYRWFVLEPNTGMLEYFEKEEYKNQRPRGFVNLAGSVICPSDEDSMTFNVNAANGEIYRLRAANTKERQIWVDRLRTTSQQHTDLLAPRAAQVVNPSHEKCRSLTARHNSLSSELSFQKRVFRAELGLRSSSHPNLGPSRHSGIEHPSGASSQWYSEGQDNEATTTVRTRSHHKSIAFSMADPLREVKEFVSEVEEHQHHLIHKIEDLPPGGHFINGLDKDMLLLKATSQATLVCLEKCLNMLQQQHNASMQKSSLPAGATVEWIEPRQKIGAGEFKLRSARMSGRSGSESSVASFNSAVLDSPKAVPVNHDDDVEDTEDHTENDLGGVEEHKSIILHLLSQLKLGMDLTKVVLPTFILEKRSLLEMFADCMAHPDIFLKIPDASDPESRMLQVVEWYLTSFHAGRQGSVAKKPYNPVIGETFHCSWDMTPGGSEDSSKKSGKLVYCAEQVSHHPPISAFYFECPEKNVCMNASIWTKSKFMGMSIGVVMVGKISLHLLNHGEEYIFSLPSAYCRSILTYPWVELGDKVSVTCRKTGYSASVTFHTKPFYGGKLHRLTTEVRSGASADVVCRVAGEWNGSLEFSYSNGNQKVVDVNKLQIIKKKVRPLNVQGDYESRKLWQHVTNALKMGDINTATEHKKFLEDRQREGERHRKEHHTPFPTKFFHKDGDSWVFNKMLH